MDTKVYRKVYRFFGGENDDRCKPRVELPCPERLLMQEKIFRPGRQFFVTLVEETAVVAERLLESSAKSTTVKKDGIKDGRKTHPRAMRSVPNSPDSRTPHRTVRAAPILAFPEKSCVSI